MKKGLKAAALIMCAVMMIGLAVACGETEQTPAPEHDISFTGTITLNEINYVVVMNGDDGAFTVDAGSFKTVTGGTYSYTEGKGYTFTFSDASGTIVRTQYDTASKEFRFIYTLDLGAARGSGNLRLVYKDESFVLSEVWADIPSFSGTGKWFGGAVSADMAIACSPDGTFRMFSSSNPDDINEIIGTYEYIAGKYVFITDDGDEYASTLNAETGLHEFTIPVYRPSLESYGAADGIAEMVQIVLSVD